MRRENHLNLGSQLPDIAQLNERVTLRTFESTRDVNGAEVLAWSDSWTDWVKVDYSRTGSSEELLGDQYIVTTRLKFTLRYQISQSVNEKMRFLYDGEEFDILFKEELGQRRFIQFTCEKRI